jgi:hypothetical protein
MGKIIRLRESELINLIKKLVLEQTTTEPIFERDKVTHYTTLTSTANLNTEICFIPKGDLFHVFFVTIGKHDMEVGRYLGDTPLLEEITVTLDENGNMVLIGEAERAHEIFSEFGANSRGVVVCNKKQPIIGILKFTKEIFPNMTAVKAESGNEIQYGKSYFEGKKGLPNNRLGLDSTHKIIEVV